MAGVRELTRIKSAVATSILRAVGRLSRTLFRSLTIDRPGRAVRPRPHLRRRRLRRAGGATRAFGRRAAGRPHGPAGRGPVVPGGAICAWDLDRSGGPGEASRRRAIARARLPREPVGPAPTTPSLRARVACSTSPGPLLRARLLHLPAPLDSRHAWARQSMGPAAFSLSGVTHTLCSAEAVRQLCDLVTAPFEPYDALICTSEAVVRDGPVGDRRLCLVPPRPARRIARRSTSAWRRSRWAWTSNGSAPPRPRSGPRGDATGRRRRRGRRPVRRPAVAPRQGAPVPDVPRRRAAAAIDGPAHPPDPRPAGRRTARSSTPSSTGPAPSRRA